MSEKLQELAPSLQTAAKTIYAGLKILKKEGGELLGREVLKKVEQSIEFTDWELMPLEKTGKVRWQSIFKFYTVDCVKAGYLLKSKGTWYLTKEGEKAIAKHDAVSLLRDIQEAYKKWDKNRIKEDKSSEVEEIIDNKELLKANIDDLEGQAIEEIRDYIKEKNPYDFQELVASLLSAMGYHISENAKRGPDGGIDIIAYNDPLGTKPPRIIVQVKHRPEATISSDEIQKLSGTMKRPTDVGIFVTSGTFSNPSKKEAKMSGQHIELIDFKRFVSLWQEYYDKLEDEQKNMLPLHPIYFLGSNE